MADIIHPERLEKRLHPDLIKVFRRAVMSYSIHDMLVLPSVRTMAEQRVLVASHKSTTLHSRHVIENNKCGFSCAIDAIVSIPRNGSREIDWSWHGVQTFNASMQHASGDLGIPIEWGGSWRSFKDGDHWQLPWAAYP